MTKRGLIVAGIIGLAAAITAGAVLNRAAAVQSIDLLVLGLDVIAAGIAGRLILGTARTHRYFALGTVLLSAIAAIILTSSTTNYLISQAVSFGKPNPVPSAALVTTAIIGFVAYLLAATVYGFAGARQGVGVGSRVGLLLLLLLAVIPILNVLGLIGLTITAVARTGSATPAPASASS
jgi:hypothetical protein